MFKATVTITPKTSILDPQGQAVQRAIHQLGMECVTSARVGKIIHLDIEGSDLEKTRAKLDQISRDFLANPVVEDYSIDIVS